MNTIHLKPKYEKIRKDLVKNNIDHFNKKNPTNGIIEQQALMIAQGLQLSEEYSDESNN